MIDPDEEIDPWAQGGSMSQDWTAGPPAAFDVPRPVRPEHVDDAAQPVRRAPLVALDSEAPTSPASPVGSTVRFGGRWVPVGIAVVFVATVGGIVFLQRGDDAGEARPEFSGASPTLPDNVQLPSEAETGAETGAGIDRSAADDRRTSDVAEAEERAAQESDINADLIGEFSNLPIGGTAPTLTSIIDIAPELADISPVEIVAIQPGVGVVEISIPSGRVRTTPVDFMTSASELAVTDFGALIWPAATGAFELISTDGERAIDAGEPIVWVSSTPRLDRFYVWPEPDPESVLQPPRSVTAAGETGDGNPIGLDGDNGVVIHVDPGGGFLQRDTGGTYRTDESGIRLQTTGDVVATGRNHTLFRECNESRQCTLSSLDINGVRTLFSTDLPGDANAVQIGGLSPSGDALLMWGDRTGGVETLPELQLFELVDGARQAIHSSPVFEGSAAWATDSSGVFFSDVGLLFFDRAARDSIVVSEDLPRLRSLRSRQPARSPTCELLTIALARFDDMRLVGDGTVSPPPIELLNRIVRIAPQDLASAAQPLVAFVGSFVSFEQPESQVVENWPENVHAGLAALDDFATVEC